MERKRLTRVAFLSVSLAGLVVGIAGIGYFVQQAKEAAQASRCSSNLTAISFGMLSPYYEREGRLPPAFVEVGGRRTHSWRVLLARLLDPDPQFYRRYTLDEPWDSARNQEASQFRPPYYACPNDPETRGNLLTNYFVVVGEKTAFPGPKSTSLNDISRGQSNTILVVEAVGMNVRWTEPRDLLYDHMSFVPNATDMPSISSRYSGGPSVATAAGKCISVGTKSAHEIKQMLLIRDAPPPEVSR